nr:MAG TPA: hypothetical protein [Caudoviricetes sp.]
MEKTLEVKTAPRAKKTTGSSTKPVENEKVETVTQPVEEKKATAMKKVIERNSHDLNELILVKNMTPGKLIYISKRVQGYRVDWENRDDVQYMELIELMNMFASQRAFFSENWIWVEPEILEYLGAAKFYESSLAPEDLAAIFSLPVDQLISTISRLTDSMKLTVRRYAKEKIVKGELTDLNVVRALEKFYEEEFEDEEE